MNESILDIAKRLTDVERQSEYGDPKINTDAISK